MSFILVAKPADHKILFEWVQELTALGEARQLELTDAKGRRHIYHCSTRCRSMAAKMPTGQLLRVLASGGSKNHLSQQLVTDLAVNRDKRG